MNANRPAPLPSMPASVIKLLQAFADPEISINEVVDIIKTDAALSGRILKAANSSAMAATREVADLKRAAILLGKKMVSTLALSFSLADKSMEDGPSAALFESYWHQSLMTGVAASVLAKRYGTLRRDEAFLTGLLSRFGRLSAISFAPDEFRSCLEVSSRLGCSADAIQLHSFCMSCEEVTLQHLRSWMLPAWFIAHIEDMQVAEKADRNLEPEAVADSRGSIMTAATVLRAANAIGEFITGESPGIALAKLQELLKPVMADADGETEPLITEVMQEFSSYNELLAVNKKEFGTPAELHARAMSHLTEIMLAPESPDPICEQAASETDWLKNRLNLLAEKLTLDAMTSLKNRSYFEAQLEQRIADARLVNNHVAVLFIDINDFKTINDTCGHDVGDKAICHVAESLRRTSRRTDVVARFGGDEFVILTEVSMREQLVGHASRLSSTLGSLTMATDGRNLTISLAIGAAFGIPDGAHDFAERLLKAADKAMYSAKQSRVNPVIVGVEAVDAAGTVTDDIHDPERLLTGVC